MHSFLLVHPLYPKQWVHSDTKIRSLFVKKFNWCQYIQYNVFSACIYNLWTHIHVFPNIHYICVWFTSYSTFQHLFLNPKRKQIAHARSPRAWSTLLWSQYLDFHYCSVFVHHQWPPAHRTQCKSIRTHFKHVMRKHFNYSLSLFSSLWPAGLFALCLVCLR